MPQAPAHFTHPRLRASTGLLDIGSNTQCPSLPDIRTAQDAHRVFEAVRQGIYPLIRRRLSPSERDLLASGQVFVWEEAPTGAAAGDEASATTSGLERWTDGRRWSASFPLPLAPAPAPAPPPLPAFSLPSLCRIWLTVLSLLLLLQVSVSNERAVSLLRRKGPNHPRGKASKGRSTGPKGFVLRFHEHTITRPRTTTRPSEQARWTNEADLLL